MGKGKRADVYLEVRKRGGGGIYFLNETSACIPGELLQSAGVQHPNLYIYIGVLWYRGG